jgi:hypothetical protein
MAEFPANPTRLDPYKNFKFRGWERDTSVVEPKEPTSD